MARSDAARIEPAIRDLEARAQEQPTLEETATAVGLSGPGRLHDLTVNVHALTPGQLKRGGEGVTARFVGAPRGARAVGSAVARNPISFLIPRHRVIRSTGAFGNDRWGSARKKAIVGWEAARRDRSALELSAFEALRA